MNLRDTILDTLYISEETKAPKNGKGILFLDIDDTLLTAQGIKIIRKKEHPKGYAELTPAEYAEESVTPELKKFYSYEQFRDPNIVASSIKTGLPIVPNLRLMDAYIKAGWKIGILTARGMEDVIFKSISAFLKFKDAKGKLQDIGDKLVRDLVKAINDDNKKYKGRTDFEKKAIVLQNYADKGYEVKFLDDDDKNIKAVRELNNPNITAIKAHKVK